MWPDVGSVTRRESKYVLERGKPSLELSYVTEVNWVIANAKCKVGYKHERRQDE